VTRRAGRALAAAALAAVVLALFVAAPAAAQPAEAVKPQPPTVSDLERAQLRHAPSLVAVVVLKFLVAAVGLTLLILEASRARAVRRGLLPPPPVPSPPTPPRDLWGCVLLTFAVFLGQAVLATVVAEVAPSAGFAMRVAVTLLPAFAVAAVVVGLRARRRRDGAPPGASVGTVLREGLRGFAVGTLATLAVGFPWAILLKSLGVPAEPQDLVVRLVEGPLGEAILIAVVGALLAPLWEEAVFRGALFAGIRSKAPFLVAAAASGIVFGVVHGNWYAAAPLSVMGFVLASVYARTNDLWAPIVTHAAYNASSIVPILLLRSA
jgi:membrane protease YdiL (CAAX protease family)